MILFFNMVKVTIEQAVIDIKRVRHFLKKRLHLVLIYCFHPYFIPNHISTQITFFFWCDDDIQGNSGSVIIYFLHGSTHRSSKRDAKELDTKVSKCWIQS